MLDRTIERHAVIILGGGPGGLGIAALLAGWRPRLVPGFPSHGFPPPIAKLLHAHSPDLLSADFRPLVEAGMNPGDLFRALHHPGNSYGKGASGMAFRKTQPVDFVLVTNEEVGGLWNNVPRNQLTLSPGRWMEMAPHPVASFARDSGRAIVPEDLIRKNDLVPYYHSIPGKLGFADRVRSGVHISAISPGEKGRGFLLLGKRSGDGPELRFASDFLVFAPGPRSLLRRLNVPGESLPFVTHHYDDWSDFPGHRVAVIGGGRSADWAATELHDAGKLVTYVMRQEPELQERLINESLHLPYYARLRSIIDTGSAGLRRVFRAHVQEFTAGGGIKIDVLGQAEALGVDHAIVEIGGEPDYGLLKRFAPLSLQPKRDNYRFQLNQMRVHPETGESVDIANLFPAGYLVEGTGLSVIGFHGAAYPAAAAILRRSAAP